MREVSNTRKHVVMMINWEKIFLSRITWRFNCVVHITSDVRVLCRNLKKIERRPLLRNLILHGNRNLSVFWKIVSMWILSKSPDTHHYSCWHLRWITLQVELTSFNRWLLLQMLLLLLLDVCGGPGYLLEILLLKGIATNVFIDISWYMEM